MSLPETWSEDQNIRWKTPTPGRGWSSPVTEDGEIWLTTAFETPADPAKAEERLEANTGNQPLNLLESVRLTVLAFDRDRGKITKQIDLLEVTEPQWVHQKNSYASGTPVIEDGKLYAHFGALGTACLDTASGKVLWTNRELRVMHENGPGSSPVLWGDYLIFHMDGSDEQYIAALRKKDGELAWKTPRSGEMNANPQLKKAYGTPLVTMIEGEPVLLSPAPDWLYAYDPATGEERWKTGYDRLGFSNVPRPVIGQGMVFICTGFMKSELLGMKLGSPSTPAEIVWDYKRNVPTAPSPILVGEGLYIVSDQGGMITCLHAKTGRELWKERTDLQHVWASPLFGDGKLYFHSEDGTTLVLRPSLEGMESLAENKLEGRIMASAAAVDGALFIRTDKALYRIESGG